MEKLFKVGKSYECMYRTGIFLDEYKWHNAIATVISRTKKTVVLRINKGTPEWVGGKHITYVDGFDVERADTEEFKMIAG